MLISGDLPRGRSPHSRFSFVSSLFSLTHDVDVSWYPLLNRGGSTRSSDTEKSPDRLEEEILSLIDGEHERRLALCSTDRGTISVVGDILVPPVGPCEIPRSPGEQSNPFDKLPKEDHLPLETTDDGNPSEAVISSS